MNRPRREIGSMKVDSNGSNATKRGERWVNNRGIGRSSSRLRDGECEKKKKNDKNNWAMESKQGGKKVGNRRQGDRARRDTGREQASLEELIKNVKW